MSRHVACACRSYCGDVREEDDDPRAVCQKLSASPRPPMVEVALRLRRQPVSEHPGGLAAQHSEARANPEHQTVRDRREV